MTSVMQGIRILEVAEQTFVPAAAAVLADWGAEVIKVEPPGRGDSLRSFGNAALVTPGDAVAVLFEHANRGKKSISIDLSTSAGQDVLRRIATTCDVFLTNKPLAVRRKLGIDAADMRSANPSIIYAGG